MTHGRANSDACCGKENRDKRVGADPSQISGNRRRGLTRFCLAIGESADHEAVAREMTPLPTGYAAHAERDLPESDCPPRN